MIIELLNADKELAYEKAFVIRRDLTTPIRFLPCPIGKKIAICYARINNDAPIPFINPLYLDAKDTEAVTPTLITLHIED